MVIALSFLALAATLVSVLFARSLARQQRRMERIGRRVAALELESGPTVVIEPAPEDLLQPRLRTQLLN